MSLDAQQSKPPPPASYSAQIGRKLVRNSKYHILEYGDSLRDMGWNMVIRFGLHGGKMKEALSKAPSFVVCVFWSPLETGDSWTTIVGRRKSKSRHQLTQNWLDLVFQWISYGFFNGFLVSVHEKLDDYYLQDCSWHIFTDQDVADVIAKYKWNFIPMIYPWKFDTYM